MLSKKSNNKTSECGLELDSEWCTPAQSHVRRCSDMEAITTKTSLFKPSIRTKTKNPSIQLRIISFLAESLSL